MKHLYRNKVKSIIAGLSIDEKQQQSQKRHAKFMELVEQRDSQVVLLYNALPDEIDMRSSIVSCLKQWRIVLSPKVVDDITMELYQVETLDNCVQWAYGIVEPDHIRCQKRSWSPIDIGAIPWRVFDRDGWRIWRGKWYYDRLLVKYPEMMNVWVCFTQQIVDQVRLEEWDVRMDVVIF